VEERRGVNEFWWPIAYHPRQFDAVIMQMHGVANPSYDAPICILMTSCIDPYLGPCNSWVDSFDAIPVFSKVHQDLLCEKRGISPGKCHITGLGVDMRVYERSGSVRRKPFHMLYANDPARGLFYVLDIFDLVKKEMPLASLHITYDFDRQMGVHAWQHSQMAQLLWECKRRIRDTDGVRSLGGIDRDGIIKEQLGCRVHCMPSDPPAVGTQIHGITQMECAAAGAALVLSDIEAFPEVFTGGATILPVIGKFIPDLERRITASDYASVVVGLMQDPVAWQRSSNAARLFARKHTWHQVVKRWVIMLQGLGIISKSGRG
jgi:glycosyltransferase involved in cell wall biosynthesis